MTIASFILGGFLGWAIAMIATPGVGTQLPTVGVGGGPEEARDPITSTFNTKATNLRVQLNSLLREHAVLTTSYLQTIYDGKDAASLEQNLNSNSNEISQLIQNVYGENAKDEVLNIWRGHIDEYRKYTLARRNNNAEEMNMSRKRLNTIATNFGETFDAVSDNLSSQTITGLMNEHINGTLAIIDAHANKDETRKSQELSSAFDQAGRFADTISRGMISDNPDFFR